MRASIKPGHPNQVSDPPVPNGDGAFAFLHVRGERFVSMPAVFGGEYDALPVDRAHLWVRYSCLNRERQDAAVGRLAVGLDGTI